MVSKAFCTWHWAVMWSGSRPMRTCWWANGLSVVLGTMWRGPLEKLSSVLEVGILFDLYKAGASAALVLSKRDRKTLWLDELSGLLFVYKKIEVKCRPMVHLKKHTIATKPPHHRIKTDQSFKRHQRLFSESSQQTASKSVLLAWVLCSIRLFWCERDSFTALKNMNIMQKSSNDLYLGYQRTELVQS